MGNERGKTVEEAGNISGRGNWPDHEVQCVADIEYVNDVPKDTYILVLEFMKKWCRAAAARKLADRHL